MCPKIELYNILSKSNGREAKASRNQPTWPVYQRMPILVKTFGGHTIELSFSRAHFIAQVKHAIAEKEGIPPDQQRLIYTGKQLEDHRTLIYYNIPPNASFHLVSRLVASADSRLQLVVKA